jgi:hypothetical protein
MTLIKSYFGRVTAQPGKLLTGGVRQNVSVPVRGESGRGRVGPGDP